MWRLPRASFGANARVSARTPTMSALRAPRSVWLSLLALLCLPVSLPAGTVAPRPAYLPRYDLDMDLDVAQHVAHVRMEATWINPTAEATDRLVFNAHSRYVVPDDQIGFTAKMLEILRMAPSDAMGIKEPPLVVDRVLLKGLPLEFRYKGDTKTSLVVPM